MIDTPGEDKRNLLKERRRKIGKRIAKERRKMGLTQAGLAEKLSAMLDDSEDCITISIAQTTISSWERGNTLPSLGKLLAMAQMFECDCGYLLGDYDERTHNALEMCRETGLSEASIENLCFLNKWGMTETARVIDFLLLDDRKRYPSHNFRSVLNLLNFFISYQDNQKMQKQVFTNGIIVDYTDNDGMISENAIRLNERVIENAVLNEIQQALVSIKAKMKEAENDGKR